MIINKLGDIDLGLYQDARNKNMSLTQHLDKMAAKGDIAEHLYDPSAKNSKGQHVGAFWQLIARAGIRRHGPMASTVGEAFFSSDSTVNRALFPEYVSNVFRDLERGGSTIGVSLDDLVSTRDTATGGSYRAPVVTTKDSGDPSRVSEGSDLPVYTVSLAEHAVNLYKYGGVLKMSYEVARRSPLPLLETHIRRVALRSMQAKIKRALRVIINGDGNGNPVSDTATGTSWAFADLLALKFAITNQGLEPDTLVGDSSQLINILKLSEYAGAGVTGAALALRDQGATPSPLGMRLRSAPAGSILSGVNKILAIDSSNSLIEVAEAGSSIVEADKLVASQFDVIAFSENLGYTKVDNAAFATRTLS